RALDARGRRGRAAAVRPAAPARPVARGLGLRRAREERHVLAPRPPRRAHGPAVDARRRDGVDKAPVRLRGAAQHGRPCSVRREERGVRRPPAVPGLSLCLHHGSTPDGVIACHARNLAPPRPGAIRILRSMRKPARDPPHSGAIRGWPAPAANAIVGRRRPTHDVVIHIMHSERNLVMPDYRVIAIPTAVADSVRTTLVSPRYGHPAHVEVARGHGPCRHCLRTFRVGEEKRILFTLDAFAGLEPLPLPGPVYVHAEPCERYPENGGFPADLRTHDFTFNAYSRGRVL